ncbi:MAG: peroxidase family protein [Saprospiraceae bacterium]
MFTLKHNAICDGLIQHHQGWSDDQLFHTARLINAALMAKIHTIEWNSAINPNPAIYKGNHSNWYGLLTMLKHKKDWRTVAPINIRKYRARGRSRQSYQKIWARLWTHGRIRRSLSYSFYAAGNFRNKGYPFKTNDGGYSFYCFETYWCCSVYVYLRSICSLVFIGKHIFISVLDKNTIAHSTQT